MTDDDELDEPLPLRPGMAEPAEGEHEPHPAGWLYVPDLTAETGWSAHRVPVVDRPQAPRRMGFRPE